jgi:putative adenylate-forming enzyme
MSIDRFRVLAAFVGTRLAHARLRTRADVDRQQAKLWRRLAPTIARTPALKSMAGAALEKYPVVIAQQIRERFEEWNTLGLKAVPTRAAAEATERGEDGEVTPGVSVGFSTGSTGMPGVFVTGRAERARYLGQVLAKLLPADALLRRRRIGLCLRADSSLYRDVTNAGPFEFKFFGLSTPPDERSRGIQEFAPDIFVAPSHVLADLACRAEAEEFKPPAFERVFYGAEPMGEAERTWIGMALRTRPDPIYQATEGFLGAACKHGTLHLNEDSLIVELAPVKGTNRFQPIVTDLRRTTQPMVRVLLDDLVEPLTAPCPCGSPLLAVQGIEGRVGDVWRWGNAVIAPREVEAAISAALGPATEWRATATLAGIQVDAAYAFAATVSAALSGLLLHHDVSIPIEVGTLQPMTSFKRRRVRWSDG